MSCRRSKRKNQPYCKKFDPGGGTIRIGKDDSPIRAEPNVIGRNTMSVFTSAEIAYLQSQRIGRIATVGPEGQPHVVPVGFRYNPEQDSIDIGGASGFTSR